MNKSKKDIEYEFNSFCISVLKNKTKDYYRALRKNNEVSLDALLERGIEVTSYIHDYEVFKEVFEVDGIKVHVIDSEIIKCLRLLPEAKREIILLYYFLEMTDDEIAKQLDVVRQTVQYRRNESLKIMKKIIMDLHNE